MTDKPKVKRGNPNLKKGVNNPKGELDPAGPIVAPARQLKVYIKRCADFMDNEGWAHLEEVARTRFHKQQVPALKVLASYGYGNPDIAVDVTSNGKAITNVAAFLANSQGAEGSGGD